MPLFQNESKCETILMKMTLICINEPVWETHFRMKTRFDAEAKLYFGV